MTKLQEVFDSALMQVHSSDGLWEWLENEQISIGFTTYQTNRLMLVGRNANGRLAINERLFDKPMGLYAQADRLYMSTRYQIWQFDNHLANLSMPHSPRWYQGKLWILNAGTSELGYVDDHKFVPIAFCQGFVRGLAFWGDLAIVGLSKLRSASFSGLVLEERLLAEGKTAQCGLMAINIHSGEIVHSLFLDKPIEELFDVVVLPNVARPMSLGFQDEDIERLVTFPNSHGLVTTKPTVKRPSDVKPAIASLPTKERVDRENQESRQYEAMERQEQLAGANVKFQRVFHLNPESLVTYDPMTFSSLQQRWQSQPQRGEIIGVSASVLSDMVGFAIAELLPNLKAEIISLFVDPNHRQKGVGTKMLAFLEREIWSQKFEQIALVYAPTPLADRALTSMFRKLRWAAPRSLANGFKVALKGLPTVNPAISKSAKVKFEEGKRKFLEQNLEQAIACFREAIALQSDYIPAYNQLGNALQTLGQSERAIACYQKILAINPNVAAAHCNLGSIWQPHSGAFKILLSLLKAVIGSLKLEK